MKYNASKNNYSNFDVFVDNTLKARSYFIPFTSKKEADEVSLLEKRYKSSKVHVLNGEWDFKFYNNPNDFSEDFDTNELTFGTIEVPSCIQFKGYSNHFYLNTRYQFPLKPPVIPTKEKVGSIFYWIGSDSGVGLHKAKPEEEYNFIYLYRKKLTIKDISKKYILTFLGVANNLELYINGKYVGYFEESHNMHEFDITSFISEGENEMVAVCHRWCNGTYLEAQDMFRNNGIFRDVLLHEIDNDDIYDFLFEPVYKNGQYKAKVKIVSFSENKVHISSKDNIFDEFDVVVNNKNNDGYYEQTVEIDVNNVIEWNAENPKLYSIYLETKSECIKVDVGFKHIDIIGTEFKINNQLVKLKGVNHHDYLPHSGYTMSPKEILKDLELCKDYNINTIRTSHYPPDPLLLELADKMGIYIVDENDIETHGVWSQRLIMTYNLISHDKKWEKHFINRITHLYQRDKNHPSIIMWSLGNEAGGYYNQDRMYEYLKEHTTIPVHYESAIHSRRKAYDVGSQMYPSVHTVHLIGEKRCKIKQLNDRPYFMCEYAHAMGVGPGGIEDYWKEIYSYDNLMGGCIWEMNDHAILHDDNSYTYGGDHNEYMHDSNFCVDGIFYPDRSPSTGARLAKFTYRPIRIKHIEANKFELFNTTSFTNSSEYKIEVRYNEDSFVLNTNVKPLSKEVIEIDIKEIDIEKDQFITFITYDKEGKEVSKEQLILNEHISTAINKSNKFNCDISILENGNVNIKNDKLLVESASPYTLLFRAPTDNDNGFMKNYNMKNFTFEDITLVSKNVSDNKIEVKTKVKTKKHIFECVDVYESLEDGILLTSTLKCLKGSGYMPRFAKSFKLNEAFDNVEYYGRNQESYNDMKDYSIIEKVNTTVDKMTEPNIRPQESGNRMDTRYLKLSSIDTSVTFEAVGNSFELGVKPYSDKELLSMAHREDEIRTGTYVSISCFQSGIGTAACGPLPNKNCLYKAKDEYTLKFKIKL